MKKLKKHLKEWTLDPTGWHLSGSNITFNINELEEEKERWIKDDGNVNQRRWEIEECFRIMKIEFKARPVYLQRDDRIQAHFITCFISLMIYRLLEKKLEEKFTCNQIISELRDMNFYEIKGEGYVPTYIRTDFTDTLHDAFGFRTDY